MILIATYRHDQNSMALLVFMIIDENGSSGIIGLAYMKSESESCTISVGESMKFSDGEVINTKVIMADEDISHRSAFAKVTA